jgi:hypothetical protein
MGKELIHLVSIQIMSKTFMGWVLNFEILITCLNDWTFNQVYYES